MSTKALLSEHFCLICDVLGFQARIRDAYKQGKQEQLATEFLSAVATAMPEVTPDAELTDVKGRPEWHLRVLTDNIVLASEIDQLIAGEDQFCAIVSAVSRFQHAMIDGGFFVRGGLDAGSLFCDSESIIGLSLLDAHDLEAKVAKYPRIVCSARMLGYLAEQMNFYSSVDISPHNSELLVDTDECVFINYFQTTCFYGMEYAWIEELEHHKKAVEYGISNIYVSEYVIGKYRWVAQYHNYVIDEFGVREGMLTEEEAANLRVRDTPARQFERLSQYKDTPEALARARYSKCLMLLVELLIEARDGKDITLLAGVVATLQRNLDGMALACEEWAQAASSRAHALLEAAEQGTTLARAACASVTDPRQSAGPIEVFYTWVGSNSRLLRPEWPVDPLNQRGRNPF